MRVYASVDDPHMSLRDVPAHAQRAERLGFDGLIVPEVVNDAVLTSLLALEHTTTLRVLTGVVIAFARSPMVLAQQAWGLAEMSGGRFEIGVGPQVKGNIEKRFGMPWSAPAARMRDYVGGMRAIFDCWQNDAPLRFTSESYTLTRMQPFFKPAPLVGGVTPPIVMGAIGPKMCEVAGELADRVIGHPTNSTPEYLRDVMRPRLDDGGRRTERAPPAVDLIANPMIATGPNDEVVAAEREAARQVLTFTYSTPAYWATLEHHGWEGTGQALLDKTRSGDWAGMNALVTDEMLDVLVPSAPHDQIAATLRDRYDGVADGISLRMPQDPGSDSVFADVVAAIRA
jgi:probable F420-dependent oxidoreductase